MATDKLELHLITWFWSNWFLINLKENALNPQTAFNLIVLIKNSGFITPFWRIITLKSVIERSGELNLPSQVGKGDQTKFSLSSMGHNWLMMAVWKIKVTSLVLFIILFGLKQCCKIRHAGRVGNGFGPYICITMAQSVDALPFILL